MNPYRDGPRNRHYFTKTGYVDLSQVVEIWRIPGDEVRWEVRYKGGPSHSSMFADDSGTNLFEAFKLYTEQQP